MGSKKLAQIIVINNKFHVTENVIATIEADQLATPKFQEPEKENIRQIERIKINKNKSIVVINPMDKSLLCTIPIILKGRLLISEFPNLLTLYLNNAIESYNFSNDIFNEAEIVRLLKSGQALKLNNHKLYNSFLLNRINVIFYLSITIELLLNSKIPFDFKYQIKDVLLDKKQIEERLPFKDKLRLVNKILKDDDKNIDTASINILIEIYSIRSNLVHPKTADSKLGQDYSMEPIALTFSDDIVKYIKAVIKLLDKWEPGLLTFDELQGGDS
jgi:hypothetical protein